MDKRGRTFFVNLRGDIAGYVDSDSNTVVYKYDAWGNLLNPTEEDENPFRYAGEYFDQETGFIYLRNRYYDPSEGRFTTEDPIQDGLNWYVYCGNNPVMRIDPWGLDSYIFYVYSISADDTNKTTHDEAIIWKEKMQNKYDTDAHCFEIRNTSHFEAMWDSLSRANNIDSIIIIAHGSVANINGEGVGYAMLPDGNLYAKDIENMDKNDISADDLNSVTMKELIFSTCNSANLDVYNLTYGFKINNNITGTITAWDGGTVFDYSKKDNVRGGGKNFFWQSWEDEMSMQYTWWKWVKKDKKGIPVRKREGKRIIAGQ